ncbi:hypothetical protein YC2023_078637 [Brassica napus]
MTKSKSKKKGKLPSHPAAQQNEIRGTPTSIWTSVHTSSVHNTFPMNGIYVQQLPAVRRKCISSTKCPRQKYVPLGNALLDLSLCEQGLSAELYFKNKEMGETFSIIPTSAITQQTSILNSWLTLVLGTKEEKKKESADEAVFSMCPILLYSVVQE